MVYKEHEGSFLVGVLAALTTKTDKVGFVGGMQFAVIESSRPASRRVSGRPTNIDILTNYRFLR